jgi:hypothetical protein
VLDITIQIDKEKSSSGFVRGVVIRDGIEIPFMVYLNYIPSRNSYHLAVRSKHGILGTYEDGKAIKSKIKDTVRGYWIDSSTIPRRVEWVSTA